MGGRGRRGRPYRGLDGGIEPGSHQWLLAVASGQGGTRRVIPGVVVDI